MQTVRDTLLTEIETFLAMHDLTASEFGISCLHDPSFVFRLRDGKDIRASTVDKVRRWMASRPLAKRRRADQRPAA